MTGGGRSTPPESQAAMLSPFAELSRSLTLPGSLSSVHHGVWCSEEANIIKANPSSPPHCIMPPAEDRCSDSASSMADEAGSSSDDPKPPAQNSRRRVHHLASRIAGRHSVGRRREGPKQRDRQETKLARKPCWPYGIMEPGEVFSMGSAPVQGVACPSAMRREAWKKSDYTVHKKIYQGPNSKVYKATCKLTSQPVIIKVYIKAKLHGLHFAQIQREVQIHSALQHENIIDFYGAFEDKTFYFIVLEPAHGGDLFDFESKADPYWTEQNLATDLARPLIQAVSHLHQKGIIHRDIKPENILLTKDMKVKLADFGLALDQQMEMAVSRTGTIEYMAPEALKNPPKRSPHELKTSAELGYDEKVDSWSLAMVIHELIFDAPPDGKRNAGNPQPLLRAMERRETRTGGPLSAEGRDFLRRNLTKAPQSRMSASDMLAHPWVSRISGNDDGMASAAEGSGCNRVIASPAGPSVVAAEAQQRALGLSANHWQKLRIAEHRLSGAIAGLKPSSLWWVKRNQNCEFSDSPVHPAQDDPSSSIKRLLDTLKSSQARRLGSAC